MIKFQPRINSGADRFNGLKTPLQRKHPNPLKTDFIRTAIRNQIQTHDCELQQSVQRHSFGIGVYHFSRQDLEKVKLEGKSLTIIAIGMLHLSDDFSPELAVETIEKIRVSGVFRAPDAVISALADRIE